MKRLLLGLILIALASSVLPSDWNGCTQANTTHSNPPQSVTKRIPEMIGN
jgi:hypothetical protein